MSRSKIFRLALALLMALPALTAMAVVEKASDIEPPKFGILATSRQNNWFVDADNQFPRFRQKELDKAIKAARDSTGLNIVGICLKEYDGDLKALAKDIHEEWHLASPTGLNDMGVVIIVNGKPREAVIYTGIEATHKVSSENARLIVRKRMKPWLAKNNEQDAMKEGLKGIVEVVNHPESVEKMKEEPDGYEDINVWLVGGLCLAALIIAIVVKIMGKKKKEQ